VTVHLLVGTVDRIALATAKGKAKRKKLSGRPRWKKRRTGSGQTSAQRSELRAAWAVHLDEQRRRGKILDTVPALVEFGARRLLRVRGWDHEWPPVPRGMAVQGRWPGARDVGTGETINARIDALLVERVRAACWTTSKPAIEELWAWRDRNPGPDVLEDEEEMAEYERLSLLVCTPGDFWRDAIEEVLPLFRPPGRPPLE
jgi:hypothetical protein